MLHIWRCFCAFVIFAGNMIGNISSYIEQRNISFRMLSCCTMSVDNVTLQNLLMSFENVKRVLNRIWRKKNSFLWYVIYKVNTFPSRLANLTNKLMLMHSFVCQGPVVQSIVSLTSSLVIKMLTVLVSTISNSQCFCWKNVSSFCKCKSYSHFFRKNINV